MAQLIRRGSEPELINQVPDPLASRATGSSSNTTSPFMQNTSQGQYTFTSGSSIFGSSNEYDIVTSQFGILGSLFGDVIHQSTAMSLSQIYGNSSGLSFNGNDASVNVRIDPELSAKQATVGNPLYYRKLGSDLISPNSAAYQTGLNTALQVLGQRNPSVGNAINIVNRASTLSPGASVSIGSYVPSQTKPSGDVGDVLSRYSSARLTPTAGTKVTVKPTSGLVANQSNFAANVYRPQERLAPIGGGGVFTSGKISVGPSAYSKSFYQKWGQY